MPVSSAGWSPAVAPMKSRGTMWEEPVKFGSGSICAEVSLATIDSAGMTG